MKFGITIPNHFGVEDPQEVVRLAVLAEELGYHSVWVMDHLFNVGYIKERLEDRPYYHPLGMLSFIAARTSRVVLGTSVLVLPYHDPIEIAKYVATLDHLSGGRVILGIGAGGMIDEFEALGIPPSSRASRTNESIRMMKELWTSPKPSFQGRLHSFEPSFFNPKPLQQPHVPIWVGGTSDGAKKRAALLGDGWHPNHMPIADFSSGVQQVREMASAAGRDPNALVMSARLGVALEPGAPSSGRELGGSASELAAALAGFEKAGAEYVVFSLDSGDVAKLEERMRDLASEVIPRV